MRKKRKQGRETWRESFLPMAREKKAIKEVWCHNRPSNHRHSCISHKLCHLFQLKTNDRQYKEQQQLGCGFPTAVQPSKRISKNIQTPRKHQTCFQPLGTNQISCLSMEEVHRRMDVLNKCVHVCVRKRKRGFS